MVLSNYYKVKKRVEEDSCGVFKGWGTEYWNSLSFFKKVKLANLSVRNSNQFIFDVFYKDQLEALSGFIKFNKLTPIINRRVLKVLGIK